MFLESGGLAGVHLHFNRRSGDDIIRSVSSHFTKKLAGTDGNTAFTLRAHPVEQDEGGLEHAVCLAVADADW